MPSFKQKNLEAKLKLEQAVGKRFIDYAQASPSQVASDFHVFGGGCIDCGGYITERNLEFFGYDIEKVKDYNCQQKV